MIVLHSPSRISFTQTHSVLDPCDFEAQDRALFLELSYGDLSQCLDTVSAKKNSEDTSSRTFPLGKQQLWCLCHQPDDGCLWFAVISVMSGTMVTVLELLWILDLKWQKVITNLFFQHAVPHLRTPVQLMLMDHVLVLRSIPVTHVWTFSGVMLTVWLFVSWWGTPMKMWCIGGEIVFCSIW